MAKIKCTAPNCACSDRQPGGELCGFTEFGECDHQRAGQWWAIAHTDGQIVATAEGYRECSDKAAVAMPWGRHTVAPYYLTTIAPKGAENVA